MELWNLKTGREVILSDLKLKAEISLKRYITLPDSPQSGLLTEKFFQLLTSSNF
jgi:hypothetical protein